LAAMPAVGGDCENRSITFPAKIPK
jgi:hypothetical protein